jgi:hypothetical protein
VKFLDVPTVSGLYVCYVDGVFPDWADKILLTYKGSDQQYRGAVYACLGSLPALELD